jgi:hypothetical protein
MTAPVVAAVGETAATTAAGGAASTGGASAKAAGGVAAGAAAGRGDESSPSSSPRSAVARYTETGAGVVLGILFWGWVALPFLRGGMTEVRNLWRAKWLNKGPDGEWLP